MLLPGEVTRSEACPLGMPSIPTSGTFFRGDLVMKNISTAILPLPLIQEEQLLVTGKGMCTKTPVTHSMRLRCYRFVTKRMTISEWSKRSRKGFIEVAKSSPIGRRNELTFVHSQKADRDLFSRSRGFVGSLEVSKRSYVNRRLVSDGAAIGFTTKGRGSICD